MRKLIAYITVLVFAVCCFYMFPMSVGSRQSAADGLLRFHVIANSDSPRDQALKLRVKDRIVNEIGGQLSGMENKEQMLEYLYENMGYIEEIARQEIQDGNEDYKVKAEVGYFRFPTKSYGSLALPAGDYHALRIVIGQGKGANWWCVMFPPLCFVDSKNGLTLTRDQDRVKEMLTEEELETLVSTNNIEKVPVRVRFKLLELINESRFKLAEAFKRL